MEARKKAKRAALPFLKEKKRLVGSQMITCVFGNCGDEVNECFTDPQCSKVVEPTTRFDTGCLECGVSLDFSLLQERPGQCRPVCERRMHDLGGFGGGDGGGGWRW